MTRRDAANKIFEYIKKCNMNPINIKYGDGYFIFVMGDDSIVHFNIKGLCGWKFAMWIETDKETLKNNGESNNEYPSIRFFCQHRLNIDRFKPTRSFFLAEYALKDIAENNFYEIEDMIMMIKGHPFISFAMDLYDSKYYSKSYFLLYLRRKFYDIKENIEEWWKDAKTRMWHGSKVWFIKKYKIVEHVKLIDGKSEGFIIYPRYTMSIHFKKIFEDEKLQQEKELRILNNWFHRNWYENMDLSISGGEGDEEYFYQ